MRLFLQHLSEKLRSSFFAIPSAMIVLSILLAFAVRFLENHFDFARLTGLSWLELSDPDSARVILSTIAGATISVAGTVFSITVVALTLASNQFGPRVMRNFIRDRGTQATLGIFLATFVYALMTMRNIDTMGDQPRNLELSIHVAVVLALVSIGFLVFFIHNLAKTIQVDNIAHQIYHEFCGSIERLYPAKPRQDQAKRFEVDRLQLGNGWLKVPATASGYVQTINHNRLIELAESRASCIEITCHPGRFVHHWGDIARVFQPPDSRADIDALIAGIQSSITLGSLPTPEQDIVFALRQLSQITVRALSPGINDPFTAYAGVDRLIEGLGTVALRPAPPNCFSSHDGQLRLITDTIDFDELLAAALDEICEHGRSNTVFMRHLLRALQQLSYQCLRGKDRDALGEYVEKMRADSEVFLKSPRERKEIAEIIDNIHSPPSN